MKIQLSNCFRQAAASCAALLIVAALAPGLAHSHGDEIAVGGGEKGPVQITAAQARAIGLTLATADLRPLTEVLKLNGEVQLLADRQAVVSTRINGQISALYARLGDVVRKGQRLARVQSRLIGDPPPSVDVSAPLAGTVDAVNVALGQSVDPAQALFHISDRAQVNIAARVYEEDLGKVSIGQEASVRTLSYPDRAFTGRITFIGPALDPASRTVIVWISLSNSSGLLKPNLFARVSVVLKRNDAALAVPNTAIIAANGEQFVFVREGTRYNRVDVTTGAGDDEFTEVTDGVVPGDEVATQGNRQLYTLWLTGTKKPAAERQ